MFTPSERTTLRDSLLSAARHDPRITAAALTGSASVDAEDAFSDIDLAFAVSAGADRESVIADWTARMYADHGALHHMDVAARGALFRVFLLSSTLQVDIAFWPEAEFGATGPTFRLVFGKAQDRPHAPAPTFESLVGTAWLYALHARSCIARGRVCQAEYIISGMRDQVFALACRRLDLPAVQARGVDRLPADMLRSMEDGLVRSLDAQELARAFRVVMDSLLVEIAAVNADLAARLSPALEELARVSAVSGSATRL